MRFTTKVQLGATATMIAVFVLLFAALGSQQADHESCAVYRSFYADTLEEQQNILLADISIAKPPLFEMFETNSKNPQDFFQDTGEYELVELEAGMPLFRKPVQKIIKIDTSPFFNTLTTKSPKRIQNCFINARETPKFYNGKISNFLHLQKNALKDTLSDNSNGHVTHINLFPRMVSPVGFSKDGKTALIYVEEPSTCGLCGWGAYFLFTKQNGLWVHTAYLNAWVS